MALQHDLTSSLSSPFQISTLDLDLTVCSVVFDLFPSLNISVFNSGLLSEIVLTVLINLQDMGPDLVHKFTM